MALIKFHYHYAGQKYMQNTKHSSKYLNLNVHQKFGLVKFNKIATKINDNAQEGTRMVHH